MPELIPPDVRMYAAWLDAHLEWGPGAHEDGFGLGPDDEVGSPEGFAAWVARLDASAITHRWIVADGRVLGGIALRADSDPRAALLGHIGFGVRPSARRRGLAAWALSRMLDEARALGMRRVLLVCEPGNTASAKTIERGGGVLEPGSAADVRRYLIDL
ncbi:GNAT family N-acetyltransferase [Actinocorallia aurea]